MCPRGELKCRHGSHIPRGHNSVPTLPLLFTTGALLGFTWARRNPFTGKLRWLEPDRRIDYIFVTPMRRDGRGEIVRCDLVFAEPDADGCFGSDHFGVMADIRVAPAP